MNKVNGFIELKYYEAVDMANDVIKYIKIEREKCKKRLLKKWQEEAAIERFFGIIKGESLTTEEEIIEWKSDNDPFYLREYTCEWINLQGRDMEAARQILDASEFGRTVLVNISFITAHKIALEEMNHESND